MSAGCAGHAIYAAWPPVGACFQNGKSVMKLGRLTVGMMALLGAGVAQADWSPRVVSAQYIATVSYGGASLSYSEDRRANGPLGSFAGKMAAAPYAFQSSLNDFMRQAAVSKGVNFVSGSLSGDPTVQIQPQGNGAVLLSLTGLSYDAYTQFSGKRWGIFSYDCSNHASLANIRVTGQYGAADGRLLSDKVGVNADVGSSTDCDSNISWILPILGNILINTAEGKIDQGIVNGVTGALSQLKDGLFFGRDQNYLTGLNQLIPADKVITLPNGQTFAIGQYVNNNLAYLIANSQLTLKIGKGAVVKGVYGAGEPFNTQITGNVANLQLSVPGVTIGVSLIEQVNVDWQWQCSLRDPSKRCPIP
ncbi:hypothetical protein RQP53_21210 [Paucibacter sp. APW11]|uniref:Uncharacterized protein n=1 Tax=Roseateles aquae TaxID=3077235 RepID=A0ABU3PGW4_9BURK|nr:hypothetical protein [Paucibacter sp. APW11]MDT9001809.1 hypothetical protein [Paucibacter sp. APW11]